MIDLKRVRYFVAVAEELHFGRAAERMHVVQPAISQQIKRLEEDLGGRLFERTGHEVMLTDLGRQMLLPCRRLLEQADDVVNLAKASISGRRGRIRLGMVDNAITSLLPMIIRSFRDHYPDVEMILKVINREEQIGELTHRNIDMGLTPGPISQGFLESELLASAPLIAALPEHHPLASNAVLRIGELSEEGFVLFPAPMGARLQEIIVSHCADAGFTPRVVQEARQIQTLLALVEAGLGVTLVPPWVIDTARAIRFIPLVAPPSYELRFVWRADTSNTLLKNLREEAKKLDLSFACTGETRKISRILQ